MKKTTVLLAFVLAAAIIPASAQTPAKPAGALKVKAASMPATSPDAATPAKVVLDIPAYSVGTLSAHDKPFDAGGALILRWPNMEYDGPRVKYRIVVATNAAGPFVEALVFPSSKMHASDIKLPFWAWNASKDWHAAVVDVSKVFAQPQIAPPDEAQSKGFMAYLSQSKTNFKKEKEQTLSRSEHNKWLSAQTYYLKVEALEGDNVFESSVVSCRAKPNWFNLPRLNNFLIVVALFIIFLFYISHAKRKELFMRRIPGLDAVDEAIGRATEMGRPIYFLTGRLDITSMSTIAATFILGEIAKKVAQYDTTIKVPHTDPLTMSVCQEIVKQAYTEAGRPDSYREDINFFLTSDQFAYTAAVDGMMAREKPAACFYMGYYYAESILLTEVGASTGAIQIAGTDAEHQLPFFFTTCDYTLIGEELYAAGAYLSKDPVLVGTLRGQDVGKAFVMLAIVVCLALATWASLKGFDGLLRVVLNPFTSY